MKLLFKEIIQKDDIKISLDTLILRSETKTEEELLMKLGQMEPQILGGAAFSKDSYRIGGDGSTGKVVHCGTQAQLQILFVKEAED